LYHREYFASRAAAQAVKAKVEAYERGGAAAGAVNSADRDSRDNRGGPGEFKRADSDRNIEALERMDPATRIAHIKAQREREREQEIAMKEMQVISVYYIYEFTHLINSNCL
jgi:hypothetical protein